MDNGNFDASNSLVEVFGNDEEDNFPNLVIHSYCCTEKELLNAIKPSNGLSILTLNCQSLSAKFDELCIFLNTLEHKLYVITLQETWCCEIDQYKLCKIKDYNYIATCAKSSKHGGLILGQNPPGQNPPDKTPRTIPRWTKFPDRQKPPPWTKPPWTKPPGQNPPDNPPPPGQTPPSQTKPPRTKPPGQNTPGQNTPRQNPPGKTPPPS